MTALGKIWPSADQSFRQAVPSLTRREWPLRLAYAAFIILGLCLIANAQTSAGGGWSLYGHAVQQGVRLYSDLRLPLQPFFILMMSGWQGLVGDSWFLSLVPAVVGLVLLAHGFYLLARQVSWPAWQQGLLFFGAAVVAIAWEGYRFDDYRIVTDVTRVYTVVLLLALLRRPAGSKVEPLWPLLLGMLSGVAFTTRANDGLLLLISQGAVLFFSFPKQRLRLLILLSAAGLLTALAVVTLTGDSLDAYLRYTLVQSSDSKGGLQQVLLSPLVLVANLLKYILQPLVLLFEAIFLTAAALPLLVARRMRLSRGDPMRPGPAAVIAGVVLYEVLVIAFFNRLSFDLIANVIQPLLIVGLIGVSAWAGLAVLGLVGLRNRLAVLFLVPFSSLIAGAMSSGGHPGLHGQVGLVMAIAPIAFTLQRPPWARSYALSVSTLLACAIVVGKVQHPSVWHNYQAQPMFVDRTIIDHPLYGPMIVDRRLNLFFDQACRTIRSSDAPAELLSMPYSYENYYCGIEAWGRHVQTYYDTTSAETITDIRRGLATNPPAWVLYQRQLQILRSNEISFNHGRPSEYRALDALIVDRVNRGAWTIALRWTERRGSEWFLIRTAAALPREEIPGPTPRRSPRGPSVPSR